MPHPFEELGRAVSQAWETCDCSPDAFPAIAGSLMEETRLLSRVSPAEVVEWLMQAGKLPEQDVYEFGQPPIVVFDQGKFFIQVLFWLDSSTCIHEHAFSGAFGVLAGSSVHSRYVFEPEKPELERLRLGKTKFLHSELLGHGDIRLIESGNGCAHSLFHLDWPSVSVVVRTRQLEQKTPQYNYLKPYLALDPFYTPALPTIQLRMLESLDRIDRKLFWAHARMLAEDCEPLTLFKLICAAHAHIVDAEEWRRFLDQASARDARLVARMVRCAEEMVRERKLLSLRSKVIDPTHRFLLGLLLNVPDRAVLYRLIAERYPGSCPESMMLRWLAEIFDDKSKGIKLTPVSTSLLQLALHHRDFHQAEAAFRLRFHPNGTSGNATGALQRLWDTLRGMDIFAPLFETGEAPETDLSLAA